MTKKERVEKLLNRIEADLRKLAEITDTTHINAVLVNGSVMIDDYTNLNDQKFSVYKRRNRE